MNAKTIDQAKSADLRGSFRALQRAALRARALAAQTGTELIIGRAGAIERIKPKSSQSGHQVQEPDAPYGDKR